MAALCLGIRGFVSSTRSWQHLEASFVCSARRRFVSIVVKAENNGHVKLPGCALNDEQRDAAETNAKCVRVVAGPGSGKTLVLTHRMAHEISRNGVDPASILCFTFTNKAAQEARERLSSLLGTNVSNKLTVSTFHSFCSKRLREILPESKSESGLSRNFVIYDTDDCEKLIKKCFSKAVRNYMVNPDGWNNDIVVYDGVAMLGNFMTATFNSKGSTKMKILADDVKSGLRIVQLAKAYDMEVLLSKKYGGNVPKSPNSLSSAALRLAKLYEEELKRSDAVDFDDLINLVVRALHQSSELRKSYEKRWCCVLVDEFQDTDKVQYELIRLLSSNNQHLFVVGDVDQAIYGWRGAESRNMQHSLSLHFPCITTLQLKKNYRSSKCILDVASRIIGNSGVDRQIGLLNALKLSPIKDLGDPVKICWLPTPDEECRFVANEIKRLKRDKGWGDFAILYRTHRQSYWMETTLIGAGIPYIVLGSTPLLSFKVVRDLLAYLQFVLNQDDELALLRIINTPPRAIGAKTLNIFKSFAQTNNLSLWHALQKIKEDSLTHKQLGITSRARNALMQFHELITSLIQLSEGASVVAVAEAAVERTDYMNYIRKAAADAEKNVSHVLQLLENAAAAGLKHGKGRSALVMFLQDIKLIAEASEHQKEGERNDVVKLMTLHAAKGLEFKCVFIIGLNNGVLPHRSSDPEEERRLFYVGITRAQDILYLTHTHGWCYEVDFVVDETKNKYTVEMSDLLKEVMDSPSVQLMESHAEYIRPK